MQHACGEGVSRNDHGVAYRALSKSARLLAFA
jgi:hypothetical protein